MLLTVFFYMVLIISIGKEYTIQAISLVFQAISGFVAPAAINHVLMSVYLVSSS